MRFKEFAQEWILSEFSNEFIFLKNNTLSRAELTNKQSTIQNIHYGDILTKYSNLLDCRKEKIPYIASSFYNLNKTDMCLKVGDIIMADTAEDYTVGKAIELTNLGDSYIVSGLHTIPFRPTSIKFATGYLGYYFNTPSFHDRLLPLIQGIKVCSISKSSLTTTYIFYPNIEEQNKITDFLIKIDDRIQTQSKIIEDLELQMKSIKETLFLNYTSNFYNKIQFNDLFAEYKELNNNRYTQYTIGKNGIKEFHEVKHSIINHIIFQPNSLILGIGIDEIGVSRNSYGCCSPIYKTYKINSEVLNTDFFDLFSWHYFQKVKRFVTQKSTRREYEFDYKELQKAEFVIPPLSIQYKHSQVIDELIQKIKLEKDMLDLLKKQKAYLLKNMFI